MHGYLIITTSLAILAIKALWIATDARPNKEKFSHAMLVSNIREGVILMLQIISAFLFPWPENAFTNTLSYLGVSMMTVGIILAVWARIIMKRHWGAPGVLDKKRQTELVTKGPFRFSRNPIYVGFLLIYFGHALAIKTWLIILRIPMALYFVKSIRKEEELLKKEYGKSYNAYMRKVPRYLII